MDKTSKLYFNHLSRDSNEIWVSMVAVSDILLFLKSCSDLNFLDVYVTSYTNTSPSKIKKIFGCEGLNIKGNKSVFIIQLPVRKVDYYCLNKPPIVHAR